MFDRVTFSPRKSLCCSDHYGDQVVPTVSYTDRYVIKINLQHPIFTILSRDWLRKGFGLVIGFTEHLENVTTNNYDSLTKLHTPKDQCYRTHKVFSVFTSRSLAAASNCGRSPSSGFPNCPLPQLPVSRFSQLQLNWHVTILSVPISRWKIQTFLQRSTYP
jgi:hypothetical protein